MLARRPSYCCVNVIYIARSKDGVMWRTRENAKNIYATFYRVMVCWVDVFAASPRKSWLGWWSWIWRWLGSHGKTKTALFLSGFFLFWNDHSIYAEICMHDETRLVLLSVELHSAIKGKGIEILGKLIMADCFTLDAGEFNTFKFCLSM